MPIAEDAGVLPTPHVSEPARLDESSKLALLELMSDMNRSNEFVYALVEYLLDFRSMITDLFLQEGRPLRVKSAGGITDAVTFEDRLPQRATAPISREDIVSFLAITSPESAEAVASLTHKGPGVAGLRLDVTYQIGQQDNRKSRVRGTVYLYEGGKLGVALRVIPTQPLKLADLGLPDRVVAHLKSSHRGLVLITGPQNSGKSNTANSLIDHLNHSISGHICTIEMPVEMIHQPDRCVITQVQVGEDGDVPTFAEGLKRALRLSTEVLLVGEVPDRDTAATTMNGGETGALMLATMHSNTAVSALSKLVALVPEEQSARLPIVAGSTVAVIRQALVPTRDGKGFRMVADVILPSKATQDRIEKGHFSELQGDFAAAQASSVHAAEDLGFYSMNHALVDLVKDGTVSPASALKASSDAKHLARELEKIG